MTLTPSQRRSWARHGAREIERTISEAKAHLEAVEEDKRRQARERAANTPKPEPLTHEQIKGARFVRTDVGWHKVVRVNAKSVTVETAYSWTDRYPLSKVLEVR